MRESSQDYKKLICYLARLLCIEVKDFVKQTKLTYEYNIPIYCSENCFKTLRVDIYSPYFIREYKKNFNKISIEGNKLVLKPGGALTNLKEFLKCEKDFPNAVEDEIGQIRGYWYFLKEQEKINPYTVSIVTNGNIWVLFGSTDENSLDNSITEPEILLAVDTSRENHKELLQQFLKQVIEQKATISYKELKEKYKCQGLQIKVLK